MRLDPPKAKFEEQLPWFSAELSKLSHFERLNQEIINYVKFASLNYEEKLARDDLILRVKKCCL